MNAMNRSVPGANRRAVQRFGSTTWPGGRGGATPESRPGANNLLNETRLTQWSIAPPTGGNVREPDPELRATALPIRQ